MADTNIEAKNFTFDMPVQDTNVSIEAKNFDVTVEVEG